MPGCAASILFRPAWKCGLRDNYCMKALGRIGGVMLLLMSSALAFLSGTSYAAEPTSVTVSPPSRVLSAAEALIERGTLAMRIDPDASKRDADEALEMLKKNPDADL